MKIHELLSSSDKWTQRTTARDSSGIACFPNNKDAVCWCLIGAAEVCYPSGKPIEKALFTLERAIRGKNSSLVLSRSPVSSWNDNPDRTFEEVHNLCKELDV